MPFSERGVMKLDGQHAVEHLEKSAEYLLRLRAKYDPTHPEYVAVIDALLGLISDTRDEIVEFVQMI